MLLVGTRSSRLALTQTQDFLDLFASKFPKEQLQIIPVKTTGDLILNKPLYEIGGKALFLKELEEKLLSKDLDLAVHSLKDVPAFLPAGLTLASFLPRLASEDVLIANHKLFSLPKGSRIGTSSPRRRAFLANLLGDRVQLVDMRGNIETRIQKFKERQLEGLILARAGLARLGLEGLIQEIIPSELLIPAIGQGVITLEIREENTILASNLASINHFQTLLEVTAERAFMLKMNGNCKTPIAALAKVLQDTISLDAAFALPDGSKIFRYHKTSSLGADPLMIAENLGLEAAMQIQEDIFSSHFGNKVRGLFGAGDGNRTHTASLEG